MTAPRFAPAEPAALLARLLPLVSGGAGPREPLTSPLTGELICELPTADPTDFATAVETARAAQAEWAAVPVAERSAVLRRFHARVLAGQAEILDIIQWENGKARANALDEQLDVALTAAYYARRAARLLRPRRRQGAFPIVTKTHELRLPHGVVGVISPWNYPFTLAISDALPALLAGNAVLLKPDLQTPLSALWGLEQLRAAGLPAGVFQILLGDGAEIGGQLVAACDYIMFTGSSRIGRQVAAQSAGRLIGASMELGGKNTLIVGRDVDLDFAAEQAARGAFANAGQLCIGTERIAVPAELHDEFVERFARAVAALKVGNHIGWGSDMGTLINQRQLETTERHVADALHHGAQLLAGGHRLPEFGPLAYAPTVLLDVPAHAEVCANETFGPVCSVYQWRTEDELVAFVNNTDYGLNAAIITRDTRWARRLAPRLRAGTVNINEPFGAAYASIDAPMGGMGASGLGRRHGTDGLLKYTEPQTVSEQRWMRLGPQAGMTEAQWAAFATTALRWMRRFGR